jgi:ribosomal protein S18 acetylase RimI-like enzyme
MAELGRVDDIERTIEEDLERHYGFPPGALRQGRITHWPSDLRMAVWTAEGGVVACRDADLARTVARVIDEHEGDDRAALLSDLQRAAGETVASASCSLYAFPYWCAPRTQEQTAMSATVEVIHPDDFWPDGDYPEGFEHVFAVREGSEVIAHAVNRRSLNAGGYRFHAIGVAVQRAHRRRGLGKVVVAALLEHIASEGGVALWSADVTNLASVRLARSVGFVDHVFKFSWEIGEGA